MNRRRVLLLGAAGALGVVAFVGTAPARRALEQFAPPPAPAPAASATLGSPVVADPATLPPAVHAFTDEDREVLARLRERFGPRMGNAHSQIKLIEQVLAYLKARYPDADPAVLAAFLRALFPEMADALIAKALGLLGYNDWLRAQRETLAGLSAGERRAALWRARREAFGADAELIWATELRNGRIHEALDAIGDAPQLTTAEKLDRYLAAVQEAYGEGAPQFIASRQTELMNRFLDVGTVQADLAAMAPMERAAALRQVRSALGLDEDALTRWDELDRQRDQTWDRGLAYMDERARLLQGAAGPARDAALARLQEQYFGDEAEIIRNEEAAGFYRYGGPRRIGRE